MTNKKLKRQVETNTRRIHQLMIMVREDIKRRTQNAEDIDEWMEQLSPYIHEEPFVQNGIHAVAMANIIEQISKAVTISKLPRGVNQSITKGIISECCYVHVQGMSEHMKNRMRQLAIETYNAPGETNRDLARKLEEEIDTINNIRAKVIARTETMRASNLANLVQARENGSKSYTVFCNSGACSKCVKEYGEHEESVYDINDTANFPPLHPRCRCTPNFSTRTPEEFVKFKRKYNLDDGKEYKIKKEE